MASGKELGLLALRLPWIEVDRAAALALWAAIVAKRLGYSPSTALTLGLFLADSIVATKAKRIRVDENAEDGAESRRQKRGPRPHQLTVHLLSSDISIRLAADGTLRAKDQGKPASARSVAGYLARAFGHHLALVSDAMEALVASMPPEELNRIGLQLYERFWPEVPHGRQGWRVKGKLRLERIREAADAWGQAEGRSRRA